MQQVKQVTNTLYDLLFQAIHFHPQSSASNNTFDAPSNCVPDTTQLRSIHFSSMPHNVTTILFFYHVVSSHNLPELISKKDYRMNDLGFIRVMYLTLTYRQYWIDGRTCCQPPACGLLCVQSRPSWADPFGGSRLWA